MSEDTDMGIEEEVRLPYSQQQLWSDVSPIHVDDGNCVVSLQYTPEHREAISYFRAVLATGEKSERVLKLSEDMISLNQADYTAWQLRWLCVEALDSDLEQEHRLTESIMQNNAKNYQLWNHRRKCALRAGPSAAQRELDFAAEALKIDEKNYHAWSHRLAIVQAYSLWAGELAYVEEMLEVDVRNNSAWNSRFFVLKGMLDAGLASTSPRVSSGFQTDAERSGHHVSGRAAGSADGGTECTAAGLASSATRRAFEEVIGRELTYVASKIRLASRNESCWNYLLGLFSSLPGCLTNELARWPQVHAICTEALTKTPSCPPALDALAEYYEAVAEASVCYIANLKSQRSNGSDNVSASSQEIEELLEPAARTLHSATSAAMSVLDGLTFADGIRCMYWLKKQKDLQKLQSFPVSSISMPEDDDML